MSESPKYFIGVEGGASNVFAAIYDDQGVQLAIARGNGCNPWVSGVDVAAHNVVGAIKSATGDAGLAWVEVQGSPCAVCTSGSEAPEMRASLAAALKAAGLIGHVSIHNDAVAAAFDGFPDGAAIVISGTGSIAQVITQSRATRAGGWGHMFGDDGSGYDIAQRALRAAVLLRDGQPFWRAAFPTADAALPLSAPQCLGASREHGMGAVAGVSAARVWARAEEHFGVACENDLLPHFYSTFDKARVAAFAAAVAEEANAGDDLARLAFACAGRQLASSVAGCVLRHGVGDLPLARDEETGFPFLPLVCVGSVFKSFHLFRRDFLVGIREALSCVGDNVPEIRLLRPAGDSTRGAAFLAATSAGMRMEMGTDHLSVLGSVHLVAAADTPSAPGQDVWGAEVKGENLKRYVVGAAVGAAAVAAAVSIALLRR